MSLKEIIVAINKFEDGVKVATPPVIDTKDKAALHILRMLTSPMALMSRPAREEIEKLATQYNISALDLINTATNRAKRM
jgi:hypothetical protein